MIYYERDIDKAIDEIIAERIGEDYVPPYAINTRRCGLYLAKGGDVICIERNLAHDEDYMLSIVEVVIKHGTIDERWNDFHEETSLVVRKFYHIPRSNGAFTDDVSLCFNAIEKHKERVASLASQSCAPTVKMTDWRVYWAFLAYVRKQRGFRRAKLTDIVSIMRTGNVYRGSVLKGGKTKYFVFNRKELCKA